MILEKVYFIKFRWFYPPFFRVKIKLPNTLKEIGLITKEIGHSGLSEGKWKKLKCKSLYSGERDSYLEVVLVVSIKSSGIITNLTFTL